MTAGEFQFDLTKRPIKVAMMVSTIVDNMATPEQATATVFSPTSGYYINCTIDYRVLNTEIKLSSYTEPSDCTFSDGRVREPLC